MHANGDDVAECCCNNLCSREAAVNKTNTEIIKILSDSLFIFGGEYTSAGKTIN